MFQRYLLFLLLPFTLAIPNPELDSRHDHNHVPCLKDADATFLTNIMVSFYVSFDPSYAGQYLTDDFTYQSDSINFFANLPVLTFIPWILTN